MEGLEEARKGMEGYLGATATFQLRAVVAGGGQGGGEKEDWTDH